ncbi:Sterigmatocystin 8-O-methyltransferase [Leucoagaricus sp. SymC.cos]|nr:Sterigmatocystin 8-O-methyltransferase [Leucoagaricus sp. SymC.cos]
MGGVAEVLAEAGPDGIHIKEISKETKTDPMKLGRVIRPLCTRHIFREISSDVFSHNRISSLLTSGRSLETIQERPQCKYQGTAGMFAIVEWLTDEVFKGAAYFTETVMEPTTSHSLLPTQSAFNNACNVDVDLFEWYEKPENETRLLRFSCLSWRKKSKSTHDHLGFQWSSIPPYSHVVDVGGDVGSTSLPISKEFPSLKVTTQDLPAVVVQAEQYWTSNLPDAISSGAVNFEGHDFFSPQPHQDASVFILGYILHDWSDDRSVTILENLRRAASATTKLLVIEFLLPEIHSTSSSTDRILKFPSPAARPYMSDLVCLLSEMTTMPLDAFTIADDRCI